MVNNPFLGLVRGEQLRGGGPQEWGLERLVGCLVSHGCRAECASVMCDGRVRRRLVRWEGSRAPRALKARMGRERVIAKWFRVIECHLEFTEARRFGG